MHELLAGYPVVITIPVQWGEQDAFGHVNNTIYFRWCETGRIVYLDRTGLESQIGNLQVGPILAHIGCNFKKPVVYPDTVHIGSRITRIGRSSFDMEHLIASDRLQVVADAKSTLVVYDYAAGKSCAMPEEVRAAIEALEGRRF